jgi:hypothetical protein
VVPAGGGWCAGVGVAGSDMDVGRDAIIAG